MSKNNNILTGVPKYADDRQIEIGSFSGLRRGGSVMASWFSTNPMAKAMGFNHATEVAPYTQLSVGTYGSVMKMVDSATGEELVDGATPQGYAVTECVYNYVNENRKAGAITWNRRKVNVGLY